MPHTPYEAVLDAARELPEAGTALAAERLGSALLGSVYAIAENERAGAVREFVAGFLADTAGRRSTPAQTARAVFAALVPDAAGAGTVRRARHPAWTAQVGRVGLRGSWAYGDVYGDQTSYLATFAYDDADAGGGEHAVVALVDHNIGIVKDLFVGQPADRILAEVRRAVEADELVWLAEVDPGTLRAQVSDYLAVTDALPVLPEEGSLAIDRALAGARLALLPPDSPPDGPGSGRGRPADPAGLVSSFLGSPQAQSLDRADPQAEESLQYAIRMILDFADDAPDPDPLRWSPVVAGLFLLDWVHRRAVLDDDDVAALPVVLRAWVGWAATQRGLPAAAAVATDEAITTMTPELVRLHSTGQPHDPPPS